MDLSYYEAMMGSALEDAPGAGGGVWVVDPEGKLDDGILRLVGKGRVLADALGCYLNLLACGDAAEADAQRAVGAGADQVLLASGVPDLAGLTDLIRERNPQVVLFPRSRAGRALGPGLAQRLGGSLVALAADVAVDPVYQRIVAHQPILNDAARRAVAMTAVPAVLVVDTGALPSAFFEAWRSGKVERTPCAWESPPEGASAGLSAVPMTLTNAPVVVAAGRGLGDEKGFAVAVSLAAALGGVVAGDVGALDAGWIDEGQLVGLTGSRVAPKLYLALGIPGDTAHLMAIEGAEMIVAVQPDKGAPIVAAADYNVFADPTEFGRALLAALRP